MAWNLQARRFEKPHCCLVAMVSFTPISPFFFLHSTFHIIPPFYHHTQWMSPPSVGLPAGERGLSLGHWAKFFFFGCHRSMAKLSLQRVWPQFLDDLKWSEESWPMSMQSIPSGNLTWLLNMAIYSGFSHKKWWFSIAMLVYQRVPHIT